MVVFPNAKINLGLNIVSKRSDGFHNLETVFYPVGLSDVLEFVPAKDEKINFVNSGIDTGATEKNLCIKAYNFLKDKYKLAPLDIHLHKIIPVGAGLGGGSSDGAFMLKALNGFFNLGISNEDLYKYALQLGSDCPFFLHSRPLYAFEKGDKFEEINLSLKDYFIVIVYPNVFISTTDAYSGITPEKPVKNVKTIVRGPIETWKEFLVNDFEKSIFKKYPVTEKVKTELYNKGALYASMSGSGSAVYGIFTEKPGASGLKGKYFVWEGKL